MIHFILTLSFVLAALPDRNDAEPDDSVKFQNLLVRASPNDAGARLELGAWCEERGHFAWAAQCYNQILKLGSTTAYPEALFRLARIDLDNKQYEAGYAKLREAVDRYQHPEASARLERAENNETRKQQALLSKAQKSFEKKEYKEARSLFAQAYKLSPEKPTDAPFAPRKDILKRLASCVDLLDDQYYVSNVQPMERSVKLCPRCARDHGFEKCIKCDGTGEIRVKPSLRAKAVMKIQCTRCGGYQWTFCEECRGLEYLTPASSLTEKERKALYDVIDKVRRFKVLDMSFSEAVKEVENVLLQVNEGAALNYFRSIKPKYSLSPDLRKAIAVVPPAPEALKDSAAAWKAGGRRSQANFLLGYACEFAQYVRHLDMLRTSLKKVDFRSPPSASSTAGEPLSPEVLSAFPDDEREGWVFVKGIFLKYSENLQDPVKGHLEIQGELQHNVSFFIWLPAAKPHLDRLEKGPWSRRISGLSQSYPFQIRDTVAKAPPGHQVVVAGRFLRDRLGFPRNWFEVWDIKVGLSTAQEQIFLALKDPVVIRHPGMKLGEIATWLQTLFGLKLTFEGIEEKALLEVDARECTLGAFIDQLAKDRGVGWWYDQGTVHFSPTPPRDAARDVEPVLEELKRLERGKVRFGKGELAQAIPQGESLPDDVALLEEKAKKAVIKMDYTLAEKCCGKLREKVSEPVQKEKWQRMEEKLQLFRKITQGSGLSHLVDAKDLARIVIHSPSGDSRQTVRILERRGDLLLVQPSYGGEFSVKAEAVREIHPIPAEDWRKEREAELEKRVRDLEKSPPREQMSEYFLLSLFAKTNGFPERGTNFLTKAIAYDEFGWLLATYFPDERKELLKAWRRATGRASPEPSLAGRAKEKEVASAPKEGPFPDLKAEEPLPENPEDLLPFAQRHHDQGRFLVGKSLPGMDNAQVNSKLALEHLQLAQDALAKVIEIRPDDDKAAKLRRDLAPLIEIAVRGMNFFE